ncbi:extracellular solute-binding protein [Xinfangfangia sp. CPCC 101601]|uniref:Extracellular solute-binding protein n=1 Tax=Pseudogemmobacter lacusdianii TaxID=3069608 RepID=A0ABU0W293_9RHOB|nr:extracellular solute-binding protein [Xinfangfangia sp. CPCC 101601]MDQ2068141.1 extracellular solute-binding protein [Xinfangfangia sp. CPCC 101601]
MTMTLNRRAFGRGAAALGLATLAAPAYLRHAHAQTKELNVWAYDGFITDGLRDRFEAETGAKLNIRMVTDQGEMFNLMMAEQGNHSADIVTCAGHRFYQFIDAGLLAAVDKGRLTAWDKILPEYANAGWVSRGGQDWGVPLVVVATGLLYNTEMVSEKPESWDVIFSEGFAGKTSYQLQNFMPIVMDYLGHDGSGVSYAGDTEAAQKAVNAARDFMIEHKSKVRRYYEGPTEVQQMMVTGDIAMAQASSGPSSQLIIDGFPAAFTIPKEGGQAYAYGFNVVANAKNMDNAYSFLNMLLSDPVNGAEIVRSTGLESTIAGTADQLSEAERAALALSPEERARLSWVNVETAAFIFDLVDAAAEEVRAA